MNEIVIRPATTVDLPDVRRAVVELQNYEMRLHATRLPGEQVADAYVVWLRRQAAEKSGALLVAEHEGAFAGFTVGWIVEDHHITETEDSNRFGYISDICALPDYRGQRIAHHLLAAIEQHLGRADITRVRLSSLAGNASARASYENAGFVPYEIVYEKLVREQLEPGP